MISTYSKAECKKLMQAFNLSLNKSDSYILQNERPPVDLSLINEANSILIYINQQFTIYQIDSVPFEIVVSFHVISRPIDFYCLSHNPNTNLISKLSAPFLFIIKSKRIPRGVSLLTPSLIRNKTYVFLETLWFLWI